MLAKVNCDRCAVPLPYPEHLPTPPGGWAGASVLCRECEPYRLPRAAAPGPAMAAAPMAARAPAARPVRFREFL